VLDTGAQVPNFQRWQAAGPAVEWDAVGKSQQVRWKMLNGRP